MLFYESTFMSVTCTLLLLIITLGDYASAETVKESCSEFTEGMIHTSVNPLILYGNGEGNPMVDFMHKDWTQRKPVYEFEMNNTNSWKKFEIYAIYGAKSSFTILDVVVNNGSSSRIGLVPAKEMYIRIKETEGIKWALCQVPQPEEEEEVEEDVMQDSPTLKPKAAAASEYSSTTSDITWVLVAAVVVLFIAVVLLSILLYRKMK
ncbi:unnamed protein product [Meganyctiphanes norvegica]|uniref:Uncharacterized protein n=1 Tax=Meganyctiphanes norvegica TaxID=48144 RepID=A0AAV2R3C8_MEGNR